MAGDVTAKDLTPLNFNKLTLKQRRFLKEYLRTGNARESAMIAYDCKDEASANAIGAENLSKLKVNISMLFDSHGLSDGDIVKAHADALKADRYMYNDNQVVNVPDHSIRLKAVDLAYRVKGIGNKQEPPQVAVQFNTIMQGQGAGYDTDDKE